MNICNQEVWAKVHRVFTSVKKVVRYGIDHEVMLKDPCKGVVCKVDEQILRKDVLSMDEIQTLIQCHYDNENPNFRRAFILCLYCELRFCDVKDQPIKVLTIPIAY